MFIDNYAVQERIALMNLVNLNSKQAELFASINLDDKRDCYSDLEWQKILINTNKILLQLQKFVDNGWTPLDLFGVYQEQGKWGGMLFDIPANATIVNVDRMFIDYNMPNDITIHHLMKLCNLNSKLFWNSHKKSFNQ